MYKITFTWWKKSQLWCKLNSFICLSPNQVGLESSDSTPRPIHVFNWIVFVEDLVSPRGFVVNCVTRLGLYHLPRFVNFVNCIYRSTLFTSLLFNVWSYSNLKRKKTYKKKCTTLYHLHVVPLSNSSISLKDYYVIIVLWLFNLCDYA